MRPACSLSLVLVLLSSTAACGPSARVARLEAAQGDHESQLNSAEAAARSLGQRWSGAVLFYDRAKARYVQAERANVSASEKALDASAISVTASEEWQSASRWWQIAEKLVVTAAAIDASKIDNYRPFRRGKGNTDFSCKAVSTRSFRASLTSMGWDLAGIDVDHIVPHSKGGADHPLNYQLLDSSTNRSIGNQWDREKCLSVGDRCADAVAVSRKCSTYNGPWF